MYEYVPTLQITLFPSKKIVSSSIEIKTYFLVVMNSWIAHLSWTHLCSCCSPSLSLQSAKMWALWHTAPWCSGSSSATGRISDRCAVGPVRDTDAADDAAGGQTVRLNLLRWASLLQPSPFLHQLKLLTGRGTVPKLVRGMPFFCFFSTDSDSDLKSLDQTSIHWREFHWNLERKEGGGSGPLLSYRTNPLFVSLNFAFVLIFWCYMFYFDYRTGYSNLQIHVLLLEWPKCLACSFIRF